MTMRDVETDPQWGDVTQLLEAWSDGSQAALHEVLVMVVDDLRRLAAGQLARRPFSETLQPTVLVNEAFLRLVGNPNPRWRNRSQFFGYVASTMRRIILNHVRDTHALKRGGGMAHTTFESPGAQVGGAAPSLDWIDLDRALTSLETVDRRQARIVELRFFVGLTVDETARILRISPRTVRREWHGARLWLLREMSK
ncbi:MAG: ECF-type sigma factor [Acidobacteriota bacterium]